MVKKQRLIQSKTNKSKSNYQRNNKKTNKKNLRGSVAKRITEKT